MVLLAVTNGTEGHLLKSLSCKYQSCLIFMKRTLIIGQLSDGHITDSPVIQVLVEQYTKSSVGPVSFSCTVGDKWGFPALQAGNYYKAVTP